MEGILLQVRDLDVRQRRSTSGLAGISLHIEPGELVVLAGGAHSLVSLLLQTLAGQRSPTSGKILLDGIDFYPNRKVFAAYIGYVPAEMALHPKLTVTETLRYAARLRMPRHTSRNERELRIQEVLQSMDLQNAARLRLAALNDGMRWRTSIAVELLNHPGVLLVDKPDLSLDPADEIKVTRLLKEQADKGTTVIQASNVSRSAYIADRVIVLANDGTLAWFGPAEAGLAYFNSLVSAAEVTAGVPAEVTNQSFRMEDALGLLGNPEYSQGESWAKRFEANPGYALYLDDPLNDKHPDLLLQNRPLTRIREASKDKIPPPKIPQISGLAKFNLLTGRAFGGLSRERTGLLMLLVPLLVALSDFLLSSPRMADPLVGDTNQIPTVLGVLVFLDMTVAAFLFHSEILKERRVVQREQRTSSLGIPYSLSKIWIAALLAIYQGVIWTGVHFVASGITGGAISIFGAWVTFTLVAFIGGIIGLIASALTRSAQAALILALVLILPQLIFSGAIIPLSQIISPISSLAVINPSRYAFQTLLTTSGYGQDIAADPCWQLTQDQRNGLTDDQKQNCTCLGVNIFSKCSVPGIHKYFTVAIEQPMPIQPGQENDSNESSMQQYAQDLANWQRMRSLAIGNAEGVIANVVDWYGSSFTANPVQDWLILLSIILILSILLTGTQLKKGAVL